MINVRNVLRWRRAVRRYLRVKLTGKIHLNDLFELKDFESAKRGKLIRVQYHKSEPLAIACYTETATFDRIWNDVTVNCRGLIYRTDTREVVARPFPKFYTYGQPEAAVIGMDESVHVTDKMDGSLGILYRKPSGGWAVATKGSFHSEQAEWASEFLNSKCGDFEPADGVTVLWEIVYPGNRIVCDYGDMEDLVLLGSVDINSGAIYGPDCIINDPWLGPRTEVFDCDTYADALAMPPRTGKEGIVIRTDDGRMLKVKQKDYLQLHRIATGLSPRGVWRLMQDGKSLKEILSGLPDEFHGWAREVYASIADNVDEVVAAAESALIEAKQIAEEIDDSNPRRAFAGAVKAVADRSTAGYVWQLYDGKSIRTKVLENADPGGSTLKPVWGDPEGKAA